jgi:hypothetical protein
MAVVNLKAVGAGGQELAACCACEAALHAQQPHARARICTPPEARTVPMHAVDVVAWPDSSLDLYIEHGGERRHAPADGGEVLLPYAPLRAVNVLVRRRPAREAAASCVLWGPWVARWLACGSFSNVPRQGSASLAPMGARRVVARKPLPCSALPSHARRRWMGARAASSPARESAQRRCGPDGLSRIEPAAPTTLPPRLGAARSNAPSPPFHAQALRHLGGQPALELLDAAGGARAHARLHLTLVAAAPGAGAAARPPVPRPPVSPFADPR